MDSSRVSPSREARAARARRMISSSMACVSSRVFIVVHRSVAARDDSGYGMIALSVFCALASLVPANEFMLRTLY